MGSNKKDKVESLEQLEVPESIFQMIDEIPKKQISPEADEQVDEDWNRFQTNLRKQRNGIIRKRMAILSLSAAATLGLFISTAFVSPAVAQVASRIPYLNLIFEKKIEVKTLENEINQAIVEKNFTNIALHVNRKEKYIEAMVFNTEEYYHEMKTPIKDMISAILKSRNEEDYDIRVANAPEAAEQWSKIDVESDKKIAEIEKTVYEVLGKYIYDSPRHTSGISVNRVNLELPVTEPNIKNIPIEIKEKLKQRELGDIEVKVYTYDPGLEERGGKFMKIFDSIATGLKANPEYQIDSVGFSNNKKEHYYISIRLVLKSTDPDIEQVAETIEKTVQDFLQSEQALLSIQDEKYQVVISSSDKKKLKVISN
ncbi:DUF4030 domain-containing protein [Mesobacillus subterraneus]|uniref:DUF4030 domain-containing protein n=1 Tax=Mesobacillus subterraneus TaxID=285983 RepID=UPI00203F46EE|nr:DUF4030 domain-containing protein [Mesobacillus subterraneus]MCM3572396.1 DUF4030 domain-containing protein [Mesobacillus subterraneus]